MHSLIYTYYNKNNDICVWISSKEYLAKLQKTQLVRILNWYTTQEQWDQIAKTPQEELYYMLNNTMNNSLYTLYLN